MFAAAGETSGQTRQQRARFARGESSATVKSRVAGYKYIDYVIGVRAIQSLLVEPSTGDSAEMVLITPAGENVAGAAGVDEYSGAVEYSSDYKIRAPQPREPTRVASQRKFSVSL